LLDARTQGEVLALVGQVRHYDRIALVILVAGVSFTFGAYFVVKRRFVTPLYEMALHTSHVRRGDYSRSLAVRRADELGLLAQAFNHMTASIEQDIERRERQEQELSEAREAAEAANKAKSQFLASMSHEIRTQLNEILGFARILRRQPGLIKEQIDGLETIQQCGEHLLSLINEILDLAKIEAGRMELDEHAFSLPRLLPSLVAIFQQRTREKGLRLSSELDETLSDSVYGDERKLRQVLINLLGNAVKFTEAGEIVLRVTASAQALRFEVRDTGPGIAPERLNDLFQPFTQLGDSTKAREGTGLGLALARKFVELHGGRIWVTSEIGKGSTFTFSLLKDPRQQPNAATA